MTGNTKEDASIKDLVKNLVDDTRMLVREEVALAKAETRETLGVLGRAAAFLAVAAGLGLAALLLGLFALNRGLTSLLAQGLDVGVAVWLSPLLLMVLFAAIAFALLKKGQEILDGVSLKPRQTMQTLQENKNLVQRKISS